MNASGRSTENGGAENRFTDAQHILVHAERSAERLQSSIILEICGPHHRARKVSIWMGRDFCRRSCCTWMAFGR